MFTKPHHPSHASCNWNGFISFHYSMLKKKNLAGTDVSVHRNIYSHVRGGNWIATNDLLERHPELISCRVITDTEKTVLHMAVFAGHWHIVKELVELMSEDHLKIKDKFGYTALAETTFIGNQQMAECMLRKHKKLITITSNSGLLPVVLAVFHGKWEFARYLYQHTPLKSLQENDGFNGVNLIIQSMYTRQLGKTFIISQYPFAIIIPNLHRKYFLFV